MDTGGLVGARLVSGDGVGRDCLRRRAGLGAAARSAAHCTGRSNRVPLARGQGQRCAPPPPSPRFTPKIYRPVARSRCGTEAGPFALARACDTVMVTGGLPVSAPAGAAIHNEHHRNRTSRPLSCRVPYWPGHELPASMSSVTCTLASRSAAHADSKSPASDSPSEPHQ